MSRTFVKKRSDSLENLHNSVYYATNQNITFKQSLTFKEVLKELKEFEKEKANIRTKKETSEYAVQNSNPGSPPEQNHNCEKRQNETK